MSLFPYVESVFERPTRLAATVVHGFKRGSKELGIPTANLSMDELGHRGHSMSTGIYFGYARLGGNIYETVVSVGWNPYYKNERKTIEAHLLARMDDFYGEKLDVLLLGYLRDEMNFESLGALNLVAYLYLFYSEMLTCTHNALFYVVNRRSHFLHQCRYCAQ
jgi:riboflavin kinase